LTVGVILLVLLAVAVINPDALILMVGFAVIVVAGVNASPVAKAYVAALA